MTDTKKLEPGSELHFAILGAPMGWNFLTGKDFADMQAFGKAVWQAAINHEREECAKMCESTYPELVEGQLLQMPCFDTPDECASAIRAQIPSAARASS